LGKAGLDIGFDPAALNVDPVAHAAWSLTFEGSQAATS